MIIAIDGPAGSGKSTIAKELANELDFVYLDTGAMYRLVTLKALNEKISFDSLKNIVDLSENKNNNSDFEIIQNMKKILENLNIDIKKNRFFLDEIDVSDEIRKPVVSENVSNVAKIKQVREKLVGLQRKFSKSKNVILDGRDIGTVVFPNAELKIFLVADAMERAKRRYKELILKNEDITLDEIYKNILERDKIDSTRKESPLVKAQDAFEIDTTFKTIEEVKDDIKSLLRKSAK
ncbi:(d)CMP kinase [Leptotrichia sp. oral taxon 847]|uniref:(d)CMP kinase n=1 Tax=Leptotrichia sp. oral taxon 847 TaxID=1785996 RepID=UPI0007682A97|nr:(d)CMP kinase [Leptotrichia sp. oral taxon 847]AMD95706.1 cytidylate kinase [Leptotrichia sp. oral taxon 847]